MQRSELTKEQLELLDFLFEPCTEHPIKGVDDLERYNNYKHYYPDYRYLCSVCMVELKEAQHD